MDRKRSHQWLTEPSLSGLSSNKRQVVETDNTRPDCLTPHLNLSAWDDSLVPIHLTDCFFDPSNGQHSSALLGRNIPPKDSLHNQKGINYVEEQCNTVSSFGFPLDHTFHGSSFDRDTIRKVKLNEVSESGNMSEFGRIDKGFIFPEPFAYKADGNFSNVGVGVIPMGDTFDKGDGNVLPILDPSEEGVENFVLMGQSLQKADCNIFPVSSSYEKRYENFMSLLSCDKVPENLFMTESYHHKENVNVLSGGQSPYMEGNEMGFMVSSQDRGDQNHDRVGHEDRSKTISFGDYQEETTIGSSVRVINNYENFSHASASAKDPFHIEAEENMSFEFRNPPYVSPRVDTLLVPKSKESKTAKRGSRNSFPSNVKSLLSTGMFDGVTVKYYSWSREKNLKGIIKGTGYLCGCSNCNLNKVLNAYEFEQHANCKTKHPNNHIYFENGKTIYGVVQELKNTPQENLFHAIQNVTGTDINHKNFNTWKASYEVASLELQRIYGKDAVTLAS